MPFYEKGEVRIRYETVGSGFPLLVTPGGGLNSRVSNWPTAVFNAMEAFKDDFRCILREHEVQEVGGGRLLRRRVLQQRLEPLADFEQPPPLQVLLEALELGRTHDQAPLSPSA